MNPNDVVITGMGLVSSLGEGTERHWQALTADGFQPVLDGERFSPFTVHPLPEIDWNLQIPKRGDQRQMETWQRLGTYAAGLALDDAGMKGNEALCASMDMTVAAGGGERDVAVDTAILDASLTRSDHDLLLNERLTTELRPTLFLAQLSNLLAGNISIVHKVTGSSRTFMGEEGAGIAAVETAAARIRSGQSTHALVGGAFQTEHPDMLLGYELAGLLHRDLYRSVWEREGTEGGGIVPGSGAAFLVLEARAHAEARGARIYARLGPVRSARTRRAVGALARAIGSLVDGLADSAGPMMVISGASGAHEATRAERTVLSARNHLAVRGLSNATGHLKEAQFPFAVALAALALAKGRTYPPFAPAHEAPICGSPEAILVTTVGYWRFEAVGLVFRN